MNRAGEAEEEAGWSRLDGFWYGLAALALALAASFGLNIYRAVSIDGVNITETFATIVQGVGVALLSGGLLSSFGQGRAASILTSLKVHPRFHGKVIFGVSCSLLLVVALAHTTLDDVYFQQAAESYHAGDLDGAAASYLQGLQLNPEAAGRRSELGEVYESLSEFAAATKNYHGGAEEGDPRSLNNLGRVSLKEAPKLAQAYLLLALQRTEAQPEPDADLLYQLHRNLGWALMRQERYALAEPHLLQAITIDQRIQRKRAGGGMAYCLLAQNQTLGGELGEVQSLWQSCLEHAQPEFLHEFQWFLEIGRDDVAYCIDSSGLVGGFAGQRKMKSAALCAGPF